MTEWRKSSRSGNTGDKNCAELRRLPEGVGVRDSKHPDQGHLAVDRYRFAILLQGIKAGAHDL